MSWAAGFGVAGNLIAGGMNMASAREANKSTSESVDRQIAFQKEQSETGYRRAMVDLKASGLNPALAYSQGPAGAASGASFTAQDTKAGEGLSRAVSSALEARAVNSTIALNQAAASAQAASARKGNADADLINLHLPEAKANADLWKSMGPPGEGTDWGPLMKGLIYLKSLTK